IESAITFINLFSAISGNVLVCWTIIKYPRLRNTANIFIACLSLSDVLLAALGFPLTLAVLLTGRWPFDKPACTFQGFVFTVFGTFSLLIVTPTATARYFKVTRPSLHKKVYIKRNIVLFIKAAFIVSTIFPTSLIPYNGFSFHPGKFIFVFCYICIFYSVRQHNIQLKNSRVERNEETKTQLYEVKVTKFLFTIVKAFTCCWSPFVVIDSVGFFTGNYWMPRESYMTYTYLAGYSCSVNPLIYGIFNPQLRRELGKIVRCRTNRRVNIQPQF
ncbi:unnamed protein product, partial [Porites evermanni]